MEAKLRLCLLLIILGIIIVQGARLGNQKENSMKVHSKRYYPWYNGYYGYYGGRYNPGNGGSKQSECFHTYMMTVYC